MHNMNDVMPLTPAEVRHSEARGAAIARAMTNKPVGPCFRFPVAVRSIALERSRSAAVNFAKQWAIGEFSDIEVHTFVRNLERGWFYA